MDRLTMEETIFDEKLDQIINQLQRIADAHIRSNELIRESHAMQRESMVQFRAALADRRKLEKIREVMVSGSGKEA